MPKYDISCKGVGVPDCDFAINSASSEQEVFELLTIHAKRGHGMDTIPADKVEAAKKAIKVH